MYFFKASANSEYRIISSMQTKKITKIFEYTSIFKLEPNTFIYEKLAWIKIKNSKIPNLKFVFTNKGTNLYFAFYDSPYIGI